MSIDQSTSYYCSDLWYSTDDLGKLYFIDTSSNKYYLDVYANGEVQANGSIKVTLQDSTSLTNCLSGTSTLGSINVKYISIPDNAFVYIFQDSESLKASTILSGSYYRDNIKGNNYPSTSEYFKEKIIWYYHAPSNSDTLFYQSCVCGPNITGGTKNGVTKDACGGAWNTSDVAVNCSNVHSGSSPKSQPPYPINNKGEVKTKITGWVWAVLAIVAMVIIGGIVLMILVLAGVFKAGKTTLDTISDKSNANPPQGGYYPPRPPTQTPQTPQTPQNTRAPIEGVFDR